MELTALTDYSFLGNLDEKPSLATSSTLFEDVIQGSTNECSSKASLLNRWMQTSRKMVHHLGITIIKRLSDRLVNQGYMAQTLYSAIDLSKGGDTAMIPFCLSSIFFSSLLTGSPAPTITSNDICEKPSAIVEKILEKKLNDRLFRIELIRKEHSYLFARLYEVDELGYTTTVAQAAFGENELPVREGDEDFEEIVQMIQLKGSILSFSYDDLKRPATISSSSKNFVHFTYDGELPLPSSIEVNGEMTDYSPTERESTSLPDYLLELLTRLWNSKEDAFHAVWNLIRRPVESIDGERTIFGMHLLGSTFTYLAGFANDDVVTKTVGRGEISDHFRICHMNGILTEEEECRMIAEAISSFHGNATVHYTHRPSQGPFVDVLAGVFSRSVIKVGLSSPTAIHQANLWKQLIKEMGGVDSGGTIIQYAHSMGCVECFCASLLLSKKEKAMIRLHAIGSPRIIDDDDFQELKLYINRNDGIPLFIDTLNFFRALFGQDHRVTFLGSWLDIPLFGHFISGSYLNILKEQGELFLRENQLQKLD